MKGLAVTSAAAAVCCLATTASAAVPPSGAFGIAGRNNAFAGLDSRGGAVGKLVGQPRAYFIVEALEMNTAPYAMGSS